MMELGKKARKKLFFVHFNRSYGAVELWKKNAKLKAFEMFSFNFYYFVKCISLDTSAWVIPWSYIMDFNSINNAEVSV